MTFSFMRRAAHTLLLASIFSLALQTAHAADTNGRIKGSVADPSGAVIPGAKVTATNALTGVKFTTTSQKNGDYLFPELPVGTYSITVAAPGFETFTATGIVITIDAEYVESVKLPVGNTNETLSVAADPIQVNTSDMQLNNIVDSSEMAELPLIGRNFTALETILPGVQLPSDRFGTFSVSGSQTQQSEYLINGADSNDIALNTLALSPNLDAIDQFNLIQGPLNAEYDRNSGGIVSATIKEGTNHFHGDVFEFYRDTFLNTPNYFQYNSNTGTKDNTPYHQNIFGGTVGGPVLKDKIFFFLGYQGTRQTVPEGTGSVNVYDANERAGNFSEDLAAGVFDPTMNTNTIPSTIVVPGCSAVGETWGTCLTALGGIIPTSAFNSISSALLSKYIPSPNNGSNGYNFNEVNATTENQYLGRIDYSISPKHQIYFLGIYDKSVESQTLPFTGANLPGFGDDDTAIVQQYTFDYVAQLSPSAVNDLSLHWTRFNFAAVLPQQVVQPSTLGFSINPQNSAGAGVPYMSVTGPLATSPDFALGFSTNGPQPRIDQVYQLDDSFSKTLGHHQLKFGYDGRRFNVSNPFSARNNGDYAFNESSNPFSTGDGSLDFLLGIPLSYGQGSGATIQADAFLNYWYAQDSWKISNSFTFNYGLGYSIDTPLHNHQYGGEGIACLVPGEQSTIFPTAPLSIVYPGDPGCTNSGQAKTKYSELGPRVGFAWAPDLGWLSGGASKKFSITGGFGIYYDRSEEETALQTLETPPFGGSSAGAGDFGGTPQFANPYADINGGVSASGSALGQSSEANKFPFTFASKGQAVSYAPFEPMDISTFAPNFRAPYAENFQISLEREFAARTIVRLSYVGSLARHNQITYEGNPETAAGHAACAAGDELSPVTGGMVNCIDNSYLQAVYFPNNSAYGEIDPNTGSNAFYSVGEVGSEAASSYNSFQASVEKGLTHGLSFQLSYTYAHALDNGSSFENSGFAESARGYNQYDKSLNYGDSAYDVRNHLVFSPIYISPKSTGEWYSVKNLTTAGWEISGIVTVAQGFPYDVSYSGYYGFNSLYCSETSFYACPDVPNQVGPLHKFNPRANNNGSGEVAYFDGTDGTTFADEPIGSFGNTHRNPYHGPGTNNTNLIVAKNFNLGGIRRIQLRMESDNVFNHTQFSNPGSIFGVGGFGFITSAASGRQTQLAGKFYF